MADTAGGTTDVVVGRVVKPHGVRGAVVVVLSTDEPARRFAPGARLAVEGSGQRLEVASATAAKGRRLVQFVGLDTRAAAEELVGALLVAQVGIDETPSGPAEYFDRALIGLDVQVGDGPVVGAVVDVTHGPAQDVLVIDTGDQTRLVPFVKALVPWVDLAEGRLGVADLPGLLDDLDG